MKLTRQTSGLISLTILLMGAALVQPAIAWECLSPSPSVEMGETPYDPIDIRELTQSEFQVVAEMLKFMDGAWKGRAEQFFCRSDRDPTDLEVDTPTIKARVRVDRNNNLVLNAELYSERDRTSYQKNLRFYLNNRLFRINNDNGTGDVELLEVSGTKVAFFSRHVLQTNKTGGSARQEIFYALTKTPEGFTIEKRVYVQTKLSSGFVWNLTKE